MAQNRAERTRAKNILTEKPTRRTAWLQRDEREGGRQEMKSERAGQEAEHRKSLGRALGFMPMRQGSNGELE